MSARAILLAAVAAGLVVACAQPSPTPRPPEAPPAPARPPTDVPAAAVPEPSSRTSPADTPAGTATRGAAAQRGQVSLYGHAFAGKKTASGETFDPEALTMAHRTLPFGTRVRVTNLENRRSVEVVVNDRGPFIAGRIADLSLAAARRIGMIEDGVVDALVEILSPPK